MKPLKENEPINFDDTITGAEHKFYIDRPKGEYSCPKCNMVFDFKGDAWAHYDICKLSKIE